MTISSRTLCMSAVLCATPMLVSAQDWDGLYAGATFGYAAHSAEHSFSNLAPTGQSDPEGLLLGGFVGYAWQQGQTVYGAEMDFEGSNATGSFLDTTGSTSGGTADLNWQGSIRGVVGYAAQMGNRPTLYYATAGWAYGDFDFQGGPSAAPTNTYSASMDGWTAGFGMDTRLEDDVTLRVEYRYTDYGTADGSLAPGFPGVNMPVDVTQHALRVGVRWDF